MLPRRSLFLSAPALLAAALFAQQTAVVTGTITLRNGEPAVNVTVSVGGRHELTDVRGRYIISGVPYGNQKMQIIEGKRVLHEATIPVRSPKVQYNQRLP